MKILFAGFNVKIVREDTFKRTIGNESSRAISNDSGVRVVKFTMSKNLVVRSSMFPHSNIHKYIWTSSETHNRLIMS
jgi:hypothetical protein